MPPLQTCEWSPPAPLVTSRVGKKKKKERERESTVIKHHTLLLSRPWEHTHRANALGGTKMLDHCPFPRPYNYKQLVQHLLCGLSGTGCFLRDLQVTGANHCSYH